MSSAANLTDKNENPNIIEIGGVLAGLTITTTFIPLSRWKIRNVI
jgi:hypothetical protein